MIIMFSCFCCLLLLNIFVVREHVYVIFYILPPFITVLQSAPIPLTEPPHRLGDPIADKEQDLHYPLVCGYRCHPGYVTPLPPDGLCDLLFYQLEKNASFLEWNKSLCLISFLPQARASGVTRYGLAVFAMQARTSLHQLSTSTGVVEFLRLWSMGVKHFGLSFAFGNAEALAAYDFGLLSKLRSLQEMSDETTGKQYKRRYLVLGIQAWYGNFESEKEQLAKIIHNISVTHPMDMLVLYTHLLDDRPTTQCVVAGPTIYDNSLPLPLPSMVSTVELMGQAKIPDTVTVLFSLNVGATMFQLPGRTGKSTVNYGDACWDVGTVMYEDTCQGKELHTVEYVDKDLVMMLKPQSIQFQPLILYENHTTMEMKMDRVFDMVERKNFGWSLNYVDKDDLRGRCSQSETTSHPPFVAHVKNIIRRHRRVELE
ncbi:uncharacterized protein LOC144134104 [Amblyomma americanum]